MRSAEIDLGAQPQVNLNPGTFNISGSSSGLGTSFSTSSVAAGGDGPLGGKGYIRLTVNTANTPSSGADIALCAPRASGLDNSAFGHVCAVLQGVAYTSVVWVRSSVAQMIRHQHQYITATSGGSPAPGSPTNGYGPNVLLVPNVWTRLTVTTKPGLTCTSLRLDVDLAATGVIPWPAGATFDIARPFLYASPVDIGDFDGDSPGWKWDSTAAGSTARGVPMPDMRQAPVGAGPIYSAAGSSAAVYTTPAYVGPTGLPVGRITRTSTDYGWGAYNAADLTGLVVPRGSLIQLRGWIRWSPEYAGQGNWTPNIANSSATEFVATAFAGVPYTTDWFPYVSEWIATSHDWTPLTHKARITLKNGVAADSWMEMSDWKVHVL